jgi:hypothetical protein
MKTGGVFQKTILPHLSFYELYITFISIFKSALHKNKATNKRNMKKLSIQEMKFVKGGATNDAPCTATMIEYRTGDQFETPWNIKRQGLMKFADWTFTRYVCVGEEALNTSERQVVSCTCN